MNQNTQTKQAGPMLTGEEQISSRCIRPHSFGVWEDYFIRLTHIWGCMHDRINPLHVIFAADHGIAKAGIVGCNPKLTRLQAKTMLQQKSAATQLATFSHIPYEIVDVGLNSHKAVGVDCKFQRGSANFLEEPAMTVDAYQYVYEQVNKLITTLINRNFKEINLLSFGEIGMGNTVASAAVLSALTGEPSSMTVDDMAGNDEESVAKYQRVVADALTFHKGKLNSTECILQRLGGFDLVALTAAMVTCARAKVPFVIDGFTTAVALVCAQTICPTVSQYALPSHMSREKAMMLALSRVGITPSQVPLHAHMAVGEGTGALLMVQMLQATYHACMHMASLDDMMAMDTVVK